MVVLCGLNFGSISVYAGGAQVWGGALSKLVALGDELMASDTEPLNPENRLSH